MFTKLGQILGLCFLLLLNGCSIITDQYREFAPDRDTEYLEARATPALALPEGMHLVENYHSPYIIPAGPLPDLEGEPISLFPPGSLALLERAEAELAAQGQTEEE